MLRTLAFGTVLFGTLCFGILVGPALAAPVVTPIMPDVGGATLQRVGFGGGGHRHEKTADSTPKKPETPQPKPPPETAEQRKAYLNRYGFGQ